MQNTKDIPSPSICQFVYLSVLKLLGRKYLQNMQHITNAITNQTKPKSKSIERAQDQETGNLASPRLCQCHPMSLEAPPVIQVCFYFIFHLPTIIFSCCLDCMLVKTGTCGSL